MTILEYIWKKNQKTIKKIKSGKPIEIYHNGKFRKVKIQSIPKWILKKSNSSKFYDIYNVESSLNLRIKKGRWPNNEERIMMYIIHDSYRIPEIAKLTLIDKKNIRRYLNKLEQKGLISFKKEYNLVKMASGRYKAYNYETVKIDYKQKDKIQQILKTRDLQ